MVESASSPPRNRAIGLALLVLAGLAIHFPHLGDPLLEGAAGKQTHTAMVARNLYRGRATLARPRVDDVGEPGYFIKEFPILPAAAAAAYGVRGEVDESLLRLLALLAWLAGVPILVGLLEPRLGRPAALTAGLWMVVSPLSLVYGRAAMNDSAAVTAALAALAATLRWRDRPGPGRAAWVGFGVAVAFGLKPHSALWLGPAAAVVVLGPSPRPPSHAQRAVVVATALLGLGLASLWYAHAAAVHRLHPVPGATVASGWVDLSLLARGDLYREVLRQTLMMAFTPVGAALAALGLLRGPRLSNREWALVAWAGGVWLQGLVFAPRMFDELSRGTEYYQLPMVVPAALAIARGLGEATRWAAESGGRRLAAMAGGAALIVGAVVQGDAAARPPARYAHLQRDCAAVRARTKPGDTMVVLADRGGTVLYYCDRRGRTFSLAGAVSATIAETGAKASPIDLSRAFSGAGFLYVPFPELITGRETFVDTLGRNWTPVELPGSDALLFERSRGAQP